MRDRAIHLLRYRVYTGRHVTAVFDRDYWELGIHLSYYYRRIAFNINIGPFTLGVNS